MRYTYYPGCSLHATGVAYEKSMRAVFTKLGDELVELDDWNCCGATAYTSVRKTVAYAISARNLALAARAGDDVVAPCSACYYVLNRTRQALAEQPELRDRVGLALAEAGLEVGIDTPVRHPLEVLLNDVGMERILAAQTHSIAGFRPACYYGCQIVRPFSALDEDPELPTSLERLFSALGAEPVDYPPKVRCCGGMLVATFPEVAAKLAETLIGWADERQANCIVTVCPLCQANLDLLNVERRRRNGGSSPIPVLYFTQIIGLALGCSPKEVGLEHGLAELVMDIPPLPVTTGRNLHG
jgi:heterodisulfide reductase subunit B